MISEVVAVIPAFKVRSHIREVVENIGAEVDRIVVVDDRCPEESGTFIRDTVSDNRLEVLFHSSNQGVGAAVMTGYRRALELDASIVVKIDGDGQMDPRYIPKLLHPLKEGSADYVKGNRFFSLGSARQIPLPRLLLNVCASCANRLITPYWHISDPANGFTAISTSTLRAISFARLDTGYFFESDMLFQLGRLRARVIEVPIPAFYGSETSSVKVCREIPRFLRAYGRRLFQRLLQS